jgi:hypothetical protein
VAFNNFVNVLKVTLAAQLHQGISNDILPGSIEGSIGHVSGIIAEIDSRGEASITPAHLERGVSTLGL